MTTPTYERFCVEIITQTTLLRHGIDGADMTAVVPSCPGWNVGQLVRHVDEGHRWAADLVSTRATGPIPDTALRDLSGYTHEDPARLGPALTEGAEQLADALLAAGPDCVLWTPVAGGTAAFYARRFTHETAIHRADAALALGTPFTLEPDIAVDGVDEWLELGSLPMHFDVHSWMKELLGPGRLIALRATDLGIDWIVDLTGTVIGWRRGTTDAAVTVRAPVTEVLLTIYKRRPPDGPGIAITGDRGLLDFWLERVDFG